MASQGGFCKRRSRWQLANGWWSDSWQRRWLPRDLLRVPMAKDVLTEDLAYYYEQNEDRLGLNGSLKRIAFEQQLDLGDRVLQLALDAPAEMAVWRDGKGALRHYAIVMKRNALAKLLQAAATVAMKDKQLTSAGEIEAGGSAVPLYALSINPRRTLLLASKGDRVVVLSDPGLLLGKDGKASEAAAQALASWLTDPGVLAKSFALDPPPEGDAAAPRHTVALSARAMALGYAAFLPGFKGLRFDFGGAAPGWATQAWIDPAQLPHSGLGDAELWRAAPANPSACVLLPVDWRLTAKVVGEAQSKPALPDPQALAALDGVGLACWYSSSALYTPVFVVRLAKDVPSRDAALQALAGWAIKPEVTGVALPKPPGKLGSDVSGAKIWRADVKGPAATLAAAGPYVVFSPDAGLVELTLDTLAKKHPSVVDQVPDSGTTLAVFTPRSLSAMAQKEMLSALAKPGDANLLVTAQTLLPPRLDALAKYPAYRLSLPATPTAGWQPVEWRAQEGK